MTDLFQNKTWWIIGASEGLGRALAEALDERGAHLVLSARGANRLQDLAASLKHARAVPFDVTDSEAVETASREAGAVDGMIYCVGQYDPMHAQEWNAAQVTLMTKANFTGALDVLAHALPPMLARDRGHIVLIGSLAGYSGLPGAIGYGASKAALMHLAENLQADLRNTGLSIKQINPGFIRTRLTAKNTFEMPFILSPEEAARRTLRAIESRRFATAFPAVFSWLFRAGRFLPRGLFLRLFPSPKPN
ncbi:SDR family NAD(P)-dependent oxidoreductase [uncultured Shimia sp.]|uniref:SDR family NAD(P)-dependent oxidoreductase n=1 Tax=uncultured Shimia sp. TaxID=573152 RepID=UPI002628ACBB|nr:SDR family NAD(P)-dependent oxidoreductase [uncultured Shimia sp.]